jgi:hypothetical protein
VVHIDLLEMITGKETTLAHPPPSLRGVFFGTNATARAEARVPLPFVPLDFVFSLRPTAIALHDRFGRLRRRRYCSGVTERIFRGR